MLWTSEDPPYSVVLQVDGVHSTSSTLDGRHGLLCLQRHAWRNGGNSLLEEKNRPLILPTQPKSACLPVLIKAWVLFYFILFCFTLFYFLNPPLCEQSLREALDNCPFGFLIWDWSEISQGITPASVAVPLLWCEYFSFKVIISPQQLPTTPPPSEGVVSWDSHGQNK